ncbi:hypothetical protein ACFE04_012892 [Oxalis oulophora]
MERGPIDEIAGLLNDTVSNDADKVHAATGSLDRLSLLPRFPFCLLSLATGEGENQGQQIAAATYLKNLTRKNLNAAAAHDAPYSKVSNDFKDQLMCALLSVQQPLILKLLVESFREIVIAEFVNLNNWPQLVPQLRSAIQISNLFDHDGTTSTINALVALQSLLTPFQYFLNPKLAKEPVPPQLEKISEEILVPLLGAFHSFSQEAVSIHGRTDLEKEKAILIVCKCLYLSVRSHMPAALAPLLPTICHDLIGILGSLSFNDVVILDDKYLLRLKSGKRSLLIFRTLISRHRKYSDKLMTDIMNCVLNLVRYCANISKLDNASERIISLALDVVAHILETGPGWRLVSPHFLFLLESAIFPVLILNEKDIAEWEEDGEEYIRKNLPSELEDVSGWREDLFTARKSAINLLGVISMSKGPPVGISNNAPSKRKKGEKNKKSSQRSSMGELLVLPFLSKFPIPSEANAFEGRVLKEYFGVLMAYGGLQDFLREQKPEYSKTLVCNRLLPLYSSSTSFPHLIASANWVLGEIASCLPEDMGGIVYSSLLMALAMPDVEDTSCYPVRVSAAGAISQLLENGYFPPDWLPLLKAVIGRMGDEDEENIVLLQLLSSVVEVGDEQVALLIPDIISSLVGKISMRIPSGAEPWPQVVEQGFETLAVISQTWHNFMLEEEVETESNEKFVGGQALMAKALSELLQQAWLSSSNQLEGKVSLPESCIDKSSNLLRFIIVSVCGSDAIQELKIAELVLVWADLIGEWHAWEETEDLSVFDCIKEAVSLHCKYGLINFLSRRVPSPPAPPVPQPSIIESIGAFVSQAILQYPSATWRACSCVHMLLNLPNYSPEAQGAKQSLVIAFSQAAYSHLKNIRNKPCSLWKPLLLALSSCYLYYPDTVERILQKIEDGGFAIWASALAFSSTRSFEPGFSDESEIKLIVMSLAKVMEQLLGAGNPNGSLLQECFASLMEASVRLKEMQEAEGEDSDDNGESEDDNDDDDEEEEDDDDDDDEDSEHEETQEEFLERYAKAALDLENGMVEEGDVADQENCAIELGCLEKIDEFGVVSSLIERYGHVLIQGGQIPSETISTFLTSFPHCAFFLPSS